MKRNNDFGDHQSIAASTSTNNCSNITDLKQSKMQCQNNLLQNEPERNEQIDNMVKPSGAAKYPEQSWSSSTRKILNSLLPCQKIYGQFIHAEKSPRKLVNINNKRNDRENYEENQNGNQEHDIEHNVDDSMYN